MQKKRYPSQQLDQFQLRFPEGVRARIEKRATANKRSMNAEILALIEQGMAYANRYPDSLYPAGSGHGVEEARGAYRGARPRIEHLAKCIALIDRHFPPDRIALSPEDRAALVEKIYAIMRPDGAIDTAELLHVLVNPVLDKKGNGGKESEKPK